MAGNDIPTAPSGQNPSSTPTGSGGTGTRSSGTGTGGSGGSSGGSGGGDPYLAAQRKAQRRAANRYLRQARTLDEQVQALRRALRSGFRNALDQRLENVGLVLKQQDAVLLGGYRDRVAALAGSAEDNEKAAAGQSMAALSNRGRERANAVSEAMLQGAGESDLLRAQEMSLRTWNANQSEVSRGYFDTLRSVNSSLTDLNVDTKTARANLATEANADREQLWNSYYAQRSEALTNLGNIFGQQAELYGLAKEQAEGGGATRKLNAAQKQMGWAFDQATKAMSQAWDNPGIPRRLRKWEGRAAFGTGIRNESRYVNRPQDVAVARPEGATLRTWAGDES